MNAIQFLESLVTIPSLSGAEEEASRFLVDTMNDLGFTAHVDEVGNAVGILGDGPRELVLLGHVDTVSGGPAVELREGRLYGRGSVDAKGSLATFVMACAGLGMIPGWRICVIGAVEEEVASSRGARHLLTEHQPEACIIGEPSGWDAVTLGYKGRLVAKAFWSRPTAHSATPEPSAGERMVDFWNAVTSWTEEFNHEREGLFQQLQRNLEHFSTTVEEDQEVSRAHIGFRLPPGLSPEQLASILRRLSEESVDPPIALEITAAETAHVGHRGSPLVRSFRHALRQAGVRPRLKHKTGTSDLCVVGPVWECPIVAYGPGDSHLDHTPQEHLEIEEYLRAIEVLQNALRHFCVPQPALDATEVRASPTPTAASSPP